MRTYLRAFAVVLMMTAAAAAKEAPVHLERIKLPPGFNISVYARVDNARSLALSPSGVLYVGNRDNGAVYAVRPGNGKVGGQVVRLAEGLNMPNGVAFRDGDLYVAEVSRVLRFRAIEKNLAAPPTPEVVRDDFPEERSHGWKFIAFGPDGKLYVPVGAPCNVCEPKGEIFSTITRMNPDGSRREIYARGVRNTVGFDWEPGTGALWFTDNGRDRLGNDWPPDELNRAPKAGLHFGFPYCHGGGRPDPEFGDGKDCASFVPPQKELGPHVAALGMRARAGGEAAAAAGRRSPVASPLGRQGSTGSAVGGGGTTGETDRRDTQIVYNLLQNLVVRALQPTVSLEARTACAIALANLSRDAACAEVLVQFCLLYTSPSPRD